MDGPSPSVTPSSVPPAVALGTPSFGQDDPGIIAGHTYGPQAGGAMDDPVSTPASDGISSTGTAHKRKFSDAGSIGTAADDTAEAGTSGSARPKPTRGARGARACTNCHRLKMKCEGAEDGRPCTRCARSGHECVFLESQRGRKSDKRRKSTAMQQSLRKMEQVIMSVLQNMGDQGVQSLTDGDAGANGEPSSAVADGEDDTAPGRGDQDKRSSVRSIAEAAVNFVQQVHMLDESFGERLLEPNGAVSSLLENYSPRPGRSTSAPRPTLGAPTGPAARLHSLPDNTLNPLGLLAEASLRNARRPRSRSEASADVADEAQAEADNAQASPKQGARSARGQQFGVANERYFHASAGAPLPQHALVESDRPPELLTEGIISSEEALELFRIFFHYCSLHMFLLDPDWHTPTLVCSRSPFLFTCVCSVASKFYTRRPELYTACLRKAKKSAFDVISRGIKSPEIVQGFLLLTLYNQPAERFEEDRTWLFAGVAIRMAQDLNLHRKAVVPDDHETNEEQEREIMNRERTWYICFCVDRTLCAQMGKPYSIREDWLIRHANEWCLQKYSRPWDLGICALVNLLRVQTRQLDFLYSSTVTPSGLNLDLDYPAILPSFNEQLNETMQFWYRLGLDSMIHSRSQFGVDPQQPSGEGEPRNGKAEAGEHAQREPQGGTRPSGSSPDLAQGEQGEAPRRSPPPQQFCPRPQELMMSSANDGNSAADHLRVSTLLALHQGGPPGEDVDITTRTMYYIARQAPLRYNYAVLVLNSFGLQYALERPADGASVDKPQYLVRCVHAAKEIIASVKYGMREILRYAPDPTFVAVAYACVFLLKLIRPVFANYINEEEVIHLVNDTIEVLEDSAVDHTHTPALYASFLRSLVQSRQEQQAACNEEQDGQNNPLNRSSVLDAVNHSHPSWHDRRSASAPGAASMPSMVRGAHEMTVNPSQVNPLVAGIATGELSPLRNIDSHAAAPGAVSAAQAQHPAPPAHDPPLGHSLAANHSEQPSSAPGASDSASLPDGLHLSGDMPSHTEPHDPHDPIGDLTGWDAQQYAKAQGVDVNRVLDNSFWTSLLPPGYGGGSMGQIPSSSIDRIDHDFFKVGGQSASGPGFRTALTPGATRASSPAAGIHGPFPM